MSRNEFNPTFPAVEHLHREPLQRQLRLSISEGRGGMARLKMANAAAQFIGDAMSPSIRALAEQLAQGAVLEHDGWTFSKAETSEPWQLGIRASNRATGDFWSYAVVLKKELTETAREFEQQALADAAADTADADMFEVHSAAETRLADAFPGESSFTHPVECPHVRLLWAFPAETLPKDNMRGVYVHGAVVRLACSAPRTSVGLEAEIPTEGPIVMTAASTAAGMEALQVLERGVRAAGLEPAVRKLAKQMAKTRYDCFSEGASRVAAALGLRLALDNDGLPGRWVELGLRDLWQRQLQSDANRLRNDLSRMIPALIANGHVKGREPFDAGGDRYVTVSPFGRSGTLLLETQNDDVAIDYALDPKGRVARIRMTVAQDDVMERPGPDEKGYLARLAWNRGSGFKVSYSGPFDDTTIATSEQTLAVLSGVAAIVREEYGVDASEDLTSVGRP